MALSTEEMAYLRQLINEPNSDNGWTDERILSLELGAIGEDGTLDLRLYAALLWEAKAAEAVAMVDVGESGSTRAMGQVFTHAKAMAERFRKPAVTPPETPPAGLRPSSTRVTRATRS